jgi:hypothetical protein
MAFQESHQRVDPSLPGGAFADRPELGNAELGNAKDAKTAKGQERRM